MRTRGRGGRGGNKNRSIGEGNRRGERICRARAVSSKERTRDGGGGLGQEKKTFCQVFASKNSLKFEP